MPRGAPSPKIAITMNADVHAGVLSAAREDDVSVSRWLTDAARSVLLARQGLRAVADGEATRGAFTEEELTAARRRVAAEGRRAPRGQRR